MGPTAQRGGTTNLTWTPSAQSSIEITLTGNTLATGRSVELWMHLPTRAPDGAQLTVEMLGRSARLPLQWIGWRKLVIPVSAMTVTSGAFNNAGKMRLQRSGTFSADYLVNYCGGTVSTQPTGPGMADEDLLDRLDLTQPGLAAVNSAVQIALASTGTTDRTTAVNQAKAALASYFRQNLTTRWPMGTTSSTASADTFVAGTFSYVGYSHTFSYLGGVLGAIDWTYNPTLQPGYTGPVNYEWGYSLNRHGHWDTLTRAYNSNTASKQTYAVCWAGNLRSWVQQQPAPAISNETQTSTWRGLEAGLRVSRSWPASFFAFGQSTASVSDEDILLFLKSVLDHGNFLSGRSYGPGNHFALGMCGLLTLGAAFPEFRDAVFWRQKALADLQYSLDQNTLPDGAWYECSPSYHDWVAGKVNEAVGTLTRNGFGDIVSPDLWDKLRRLSEWTVELGAPDRSVPTLNDSGPVKVSSAAFSGWETHVSSPLLSWAQVLKTETASQNTTPNTSLRSLALPDSGYTVMRSGWGKTDHYAVLDVGPLGGWHGHQDALNLIAYFHGRQFLFDNGGYTYDSSVWRAYGTSTASHNTVRVDDLDQARTYNTSTDPVGTNAIDTPPPRFGTSEAIDYASGWYVGGYGTVTNRIATHRREIAFLKTASGSGPLMIVVDTLQPTDAAAHSYDLRWHLQSTSWQSENGQGKAGRQVWTTDRDPIKWPSVSDQPNLAVISLAGTQQFHADCGVNPGTVNGMLGWFYPNQTAAPVPALALRHTVPATAGTVRMVTLLVPLTGTPQNPVASIVSEPGSGDSWTVSFRDNRPPITVTLNPSAGNIDPSFSVSTLPMPPLEPFSKAVAWQPSASTIPADGSGTWDLVATNWRDSSGLRGKWRDFLFPTFGNGASLPSACAVALLQPVTLAELRFDTAGGSQYALTSSGGAGSITFAPIGRPAVYVRANAMISAPILATGGFDKTGPGLLRLEADNWQTAGRVRVNSGILQIGNNGSTGSAGYASIEVAGGASLNVRKVNSADSRFDNPVSGDGALVFQLRGTHPLTLYPAVTPSALLSHRGLTTFSTSSTNTQPSLRMGGASLLSPSSTLTFSPAIPSSSTLTLLLAGFSQTIGGLDGGDGNCVIDLGGASLTVGSNGANTHYAGRLLGTGTLVKSGNGTLTLSGDNRNFAGAINVSAGSFRIDGAMASPVTVQGGATLEGIGSTTGQLTIQPGAAFNVLMSDWNSPPAVFTAGPVVAVGSGAWTIRVDARTLSNFTEAARNIPIIVSRSGLTNILPSAIIISPVGFNGKGTWSAVATSDTLSISYTPDLYAAWSESIVWSNRDSSAAGDPDGDGLPNVLEYALGTPPLLPNNTQVPHVELSADKRRCTIAFDRIADPALTYEVAASNDLQGWSVIWSSSGPANVTGPVTVTDTVDVSASPRRFLRLRVKADRSSER